MDVHLLDWENLLIEQGVHPVQKFFSPGCIMIFLKRYCIRQWTPGLLCTADYAACKFFFPLNSVHTPVQTEKRGKIAVHHLFKYEVTAVRLLITTCFSAADFANHVKYNFTFWLCQSALLIRQQHCQSCNSAVNHATVPSLMCWPYLHNSTALSILPQCCRWCDSTVNMLPQWC